MGISPQRLKDHKESQRKFSNVSSLERENPVSKVIVDCAFKVHTTLGPGLLESAYEECMEKEFIKRGIHYKRQYEMPIYYDGERLKTPYRVDFLVQDLVIVELKAVERLVPIHEAQTLTYLKLSNYHLALLINFSAPLIKNGIKRFVI